MYKRQRLFRARSLGYKRYYSPESGTLRPLHPDGSFLSPFDPKAGENFTAAPGFHEGSAWNYTFYVPHDVEGLAKLMGGRRKFIDKLQMVFDEGLYLSLIHIWWLLFYHGVLRSCNGYVYAFGSALLDLEEPWKVTARSRCV